MLEGCNKAAFEAADKISEGEALCTNEFEFVLTIWEALMEYGSEKKRENVHKDEDKIIAEKAEMKKMSFQEKVTKMTEIKQLQ